MLSGLGFLPGPGGLPGPAVDVALFWESERVGTVAPARREGFLCVWAEGSTLRRPAVTDSPLESCSNTPLISLVPEGEVNVPFAGMGGGGGGPSKDGRGGGGGGAAPEEVAVWIDGALEEAWPDWT